ncbi:hypothetical protein Taro_004773 [Colocasia esculenta]|uniref:Uncharacterized protein n=1 Tax=Colocasia esculenta TaxID=4460 RepID=A0A843TVW0_COLES|nr:hypothetical protein [Colocasia esculenta]
MPGLTEEPRKDSLREVGEAGSRSAEKKGGRAQRRLLSLRSAAAVASGRRLPSDPRAFADWVASSSAAGRCDDLSLGFNAGGGGGGGGAGDGSGGGGSGGAAGGGLVWAQVPSAAARSGAQPQGVPLGYSVADVGVVGLRDVVVVAAPAASFHHGQHPHHYPGDAAAALLPPAEHPMIPLLAAAPCLADDPDAAAGRGRVPAGINLWQTQQPPARGVENPNPMGASSSSFSYLGKPMAVPMFDPASAAAAPSGVLGGNFASVGGVFMSAAFGGGGTGGSALSAPPCQDCGNQAKKDCIHRRCRTCCKSRGFDCATHVKSTWVPAARRRERQMSGAPAMASGGEGGAGAVSSASTSAAKKARLIAVTANAPPGTTTATATANTTASRTSTSNTTTPPRSFETSSSHQDASFRESLPGQVRAPAVFKCVRVTTVDDGEDEFAYQAMVRIGGHVFKGFLYDQGVDATPGITSAGGQGDHGGHDHRNRGSMPNISDLHLGGAGAIGGGGPSDVYAARGTGHGLMGGTTYGNPLN